MPSTVARTRSSSPPPAPASPITAAIGSPPSERLTAELRPVGSGAADSLAGRCRLRCMAAVFPVFVRLDTASCNK
eukprot:1185317-Prorocentrum_minimum.AAC.4